MESVVEKQWSYSKDRCRQVSQIPKDQLGLAASYGPNAREEYFIHTVRGVQVQTTRQTKQEDGKTYRLCVFPDWNYQWVNEGNIRSRKISRNPGEISYGHEPEIKPA